jgi:hypothetical protein
MSGRLDFHDYPITRSQGRAITLENYITGSD